MSSPKAENAQVPSSPPFQSAQQPAEYHAAREDLDLEPGSEHLSDASGLPSSRRQLSLVDDHATEIFSAEKELNGESHDSTNSPSRPNKFHGPPSTWRNWTAAERDLAASLNQLRAKDLSVHLYNSFKLRQRNRIRDPGQPIQPSERPGEANQGSQWVPPKIWAAWPLPPSIVPREHEEARWEEGTKLSELSHSSPRRPGQHLQEMLVAQVLRKAKERFQDRQRKNSPQAEITMIPRGQQSQGLGRDLTGDSSDVQDDEILGQKPVVMADDQRASEILQATVQHMMTRLDDLLLGLHHARSAYLLVEDSGTESPAQISERTKLRGRPRKRKRKASKADEGAEPSHDLPDHLSSGSDDSNSSRRKSAKMHRARSFSRRSQSQQFRFRKGRLGLRDWSDVLGIASMIGWQQNVVGSATARCATLLEEGIRFRTLPEGQTVREEQLYLPNAPPLFFREQNQSDTCREDKIPSNGSGRVTMGGVHVDGFLEPIEGKKSWMYNNSKHSERRLSSRKSRRGV